MSFRDIKFDWLEEVIVPAIDLFYDKSKDQDLITRNASERAIVANIYCKANIYLAQKKEITQGLDDLVIDIEYNRNYTNPKRVDEKCSFCDEETCFIKQRNPSPTTRAPDMLIHYRGTNVDNQVVIEFKKASNKVKKGRRADKAKLIYFTCQQPFPNHEDENYQYHLGFFIDIDTDRYSVTTYQDTAYDDPRCRQGGVWLDN